MKTKSTPHFFYFAPIRGITDSLFRTIYHKHFPYFDAAVAPFINPQRFANFKDKFIADVLPENNTGLPVVPQLIYNNPDDFIKLASRLEQFGYTHINWNLGCPAPMVANKQRGSGLLPQTERIIAMLEEIMAEVNVEISIKTRLGFRDPGDIEKLLPLLDALPLKEIIIHPRIGKQLYKGNADKSAFEKCSKLSRHTLVYNGDIISENIFWGLADKFKGIKSWMIGRGALANPFLVAEIKGITLDKATRISKLHRFHEDYYAQLKERLHGPSHLLNRMKQLWSYLIESFPGNEKILKKIRKSSTEEKYWQAVDQLFS